MPPIRIQHGRLLCYRIFDVGDEIRLDLAEQALRDAPGRHRVRLTRPGAEALAITSPALGVSLGPRSVALPTVGRTVDAEVTARLFDWGAVSVLFEIAIAPGTELMSLLPLCDELYETPVLEEVGRPEVNALVKRLDGALIGSHTWAGLETYTVIFLEALEGATTAAELLATPGLAKLLLGETAPGTLHEEERADVLKWSYSYFENDLVVIDWNSALVLEPGGSRDIPDILELTTAQLLEMRYFDDRLDRELGRIYDDVEVAGRRFGALFRSPYAALGRRVLVRLLELTEATERVENSLKVVGDFFLARVYRGAVRRFRLRSWEESVNRKQRLVAQVADLLAREIDTRRNTLLEIAVVVLIITEIVLAVWHR